jgi:hypothetical protein
MKAGFVALSTLMLAQCVSVRPPANTTNRVPLSVLAAAPLTDISRGEFKLTPLPGLYTSPTKSLPALGITTGSVFQLSYFDGLRTAKVDYLAERLAVSQITLTPQASQQLLAYLAANPSLWSESPQDAVLSIAIVQPDSKTGGRGGTELFVTRNNAITIAGEVSNFAFATPSFEVALHWEDNLW